MDINLFYNIIAAIVAVWSLLAIIFLGANRFRFKAVHGESVADLDIGDNGRGGRRWRHQRQQQRGD